MIVVIVTLILAVVFATIEAVREKSFGWGALALLSLAVLWPQIGALK